GGLTVVEFRAGVKKYAGTDEALGVPAGTVGGIPVPSPEDFATAEQGAKADTAVQPDDLGAAATMSPVEVVTDEDAQAALSGTSAPATVHTVTGRYYSGRFVGSSTTTATLLRGRYCPMPVQFERDLTIDRVGISITTA